VTLRPIIPLRRPLGGTRVTVPASRSIANRELVLSALAAGTSRLDLGGHEPGEDVRAMCGAIAALGHAVRDDGRGRIAVTGSPSRPRPTGATVDCAMSGTTSRFVTALASLAPEPVTIDGAPRLRERPIAALVAALRALGTEIDGERLPLTVRRPAAGGAVRVPGHESSQFASALLLAGPAMPAGLDLTLAGSTVNAPFLELTADALRRRGVRVDRPSRDRFVVLRQRVRARSLRVPGDAISATYPAAAAAILGGEVTIENVDVRVGPQAEADTRFFALLTRMGCDVGHGRDSVTVSRTGALRGVRADLRDYSDSFPALAVVAAAADGPTEISGVGYTRGHESDRIAAVAAGLRALGAEAEPGADGMTVIPRPLHGGVVAAVNDHRIAMAFAVLGLLVPGVAIEGAEAVGKTFPEFFDMLDRLRR